MNVLAPNNMRYYYALSGAGDFLELLKPWAMPMAKIFEPVGQFASPDLPGFQNLASLFRETWHVHTNPAVHG